MSDLTIRHSVLTFYKDSQILPSKNFIVDSIETYLATLTNFGVNDFQYLRPSLEMTIKVHKDEVFCAMLVENNYNYLKVLQDSRSYYYFVIKKTQKAQETVEFELRMDTINTFRYGTDFIATDRTKVIREHKDRFEKISPSFLSKVAWEFYNVPAQPSTFQPTFTFSFTDTSGVVSAQTMIFIQTHTLYFTLYSVYDKTLGKYLEVGTDIELTTGTPNFILGENPSFTATIEIKKPIYLRHEFYLSFIYAVEGAIGTSFKRKIDLYSEGLTPILYKEEKGTLYPPEATNNWYLIYKNKDNPQQGEEVVDCYLAPELPLDCKANTGDTILPSDLQADVYYMFSRVGNITADTAFKTSSGNVSTGTATYGFNTDYRAVLLRKSVDGTKIRVVVITYTRSYILGSYVWTGATKSFDAEFTDIQWLYGPLTCYIGNDTATPSTNNGELSIGGTSAITLKGFSSFDRTLSTLIKVIALPYLPCNYELDENGVLILPQTWTYDATYGFMKLQSLSEKFESNIETEIENPFKPLTNINLFPDTTLARRELDPKLLHSDYYQPKFIYDSFGFTFQLEKMNREFSYSEEYFSFKFVMTSTIRSRFMFKFDSYKLTYSTEDYDNILSVSRNNEAVIYNSAYITYLRTGYNIDVKAKERTQRTAILGGVLGTIGAISSTAIGVASGNVALGVKSAISGSSSIASTIVNSINTIAQSEESMEKNLATLKAQAVSVEGSDDLDLLENYSDNKAKLATYKVSPKMERILDDLFYYTGYISGEMKIPSVNNRYWFNFLSCELDITGVNSAIPELCLSDLFARYQAGVFFIHNQSNNYNFELNKENWEISLL